MPQNKKLNFQCKKHLQTLKCLLDLASNASDCRTPLVELSRSMVCI